jgi:(S)-2-hydroxy-acid oxidase
MHTSVKDFEEAAKGRLAKLSKDYYYSAANAMVSLRDSEAQFDRLKLKQAAGVDPDKFEGLQTETMGIKIPSPICIAATAFHRMAHPDGEEATAKAAHKTQTPMMLSNWASTPLEVVASHSPENLKSF